VILTLVSTLNPICFLCFICLLIVYCIDHYLIKKKKTKVLMIVWLVISSVLQIMCWIFAVGAFVAHSGGV
jgi:hypothetical protein